MVCVDQARRCLRAAYADFVIEAQEVRNERALAVYNRVQHKLNGKSRVIVYDTKEKRIDKRIRRKREKKEHDARSTNIICSSNRRMRSAGSGQPAVKTSSSSPMSMLVASEASEAASSSLGSSLALVLVLVLGSSWFLGTVALVDDAGEDEDEDATLLLLPLIRLVLSEPETAGLWK